MRSSKTHHRKREEKVDIVDLSLSDSNLKQFQAAITDGTYGASALWAICFYGKTLDQWVILLIIIGYYYS